ncbi:hypothetical protein RFI_10717, partial [Reticulomyxa filosa]
EEEEEEEKEEVLEKESAAHFVLPFTRSNRIQWMKRSYDEFRVGDDRQLVDESTDPTTVETVPKISDDAGWVRLPSMLSSRYGCDGSLFIFIFYSISLPVFFFFFAMDTFLKQWLFFFLKGIVWNDEYFLVLGGHRSYRRMDGLNLHKLTWKKFPYSNYDHCFGIIGIWNNYVIWAGDDKKLDNIECFDFRDQQWHQINSPKSIPTKNKLRTWAWL